jgi:large subunit ribosomal protein L33
MREYLSLECSKCGNRNYRTTKQTKGGEQVKKLELKKYCKFCRTHTVHKERKK